MNCQKIVPQLISYLDKELASEEMFLIRTHLDSCAHCQEDVRLLQMTWEITGALPAIEPSPNFRSNFWEKAREVEPQFQLFPSWFPWKTRETLAVGLTGVAVLWVVGVSGGILLYQKQNQHPLPKTDSSLSIFSSPFPDNSIEKIFLEGQKNS